MANPILDKLQLSGTTYDLVDSTALHTIDDNVTSGGTNAVKGSGVYNAITAATGALAEAIAEQGYQTSGDVQNAISGKADATDLAVYADAVKYNSTSHYVEFYHNGTGGTKVFEYDASPFLIDGMVSNVEIKDVTLSGETVTCLVISFNTDAGKQDINIPISTIFDASNYYTKAEVDDETSSALTHFSFTTTTGGTNRTRFYNKANNLGLTQTLNFAAINGQPIVTSGSTSANAFSLQDTLVSGTNIKTVGGNSLLGSGNIEWPAGMTASVQGTTLIFS